jgi:(p)ppGpp synthase/HD superfamily hydrolase
MKAKYFAIAAHEAVGQKRKHTGEPYWTHPERVAATVDKYGGTVAMFEAAWLHDVVEDTGVSLGVIRNFFGVEVASLVQDLTNVSRPEDGNRATRKAIDRGHIAKASNEAQFIKCADILDNVKDFILHDPGFAVQYKAEKLAMLDVMRIKDSAIWRDAYTLCNT